MEKEICSLEINSGHAYHSCLNKTKFPLLSVPEKIRISLKPRLVRVNADYAESLSSGSCLSFSSSLSNSLRLNCSLWVRLEQLLFLTSAWILLERGVVNGLSCAGRFWMILWKWSSLWSTFKRQTFLTAAITSPLKKQNSMATQSPWITRLQLIGIVVSSLLLFALKEHVFKNKVIRLLTRDRVRFVDSFPEDKEITRFQDKRKTKRVQDKYY